MRFLALALAALAGCDAPGASTPQIPAGPLSAAPSGSLGSVAAAPEPLPAHFDLHVHLPGKDASRHLNAAMENWVLDGCVSDRPHTCDKTRRIEVPVGARKEFIQIWEDVKATALCEPGARWPGDRPFEIQWLGQQHAEVLPANEADVDARNQGPCRADARLAWWFARQFAERAP